MQPNAQKPVDVPTENVEQRMFDRPLRRGSASVCPWEIRTSLAFASDELTRKVLEASYFRRACSPVFLPKSRLEEKTSELKYSSKFSKLEKQKAAQYKDKISC